MFRYHLPRYLDDKFRADLEGDTAAGLTVWGIGLVNEETKCLPVTGVSQSIDCGHGLPPDRRSGIETPPIFTPTLFVVSGGIDCFSLSLHFEVFRPF